jgi:hypothetical protein
MRDYRGNNEGFATPTYRGYDRPTPDRTLRGLKLQCANITTPGGGRGRMTRSKYDSTTCIAAMSASSRTAITHQVFSDEIPMTVEKPSPPSPRGSSGQRAVVVVPQSTR